MQDSTKYFYTCVYENPQFLSLSQKLKSELNHIVKNVPLSLGKHSDSSYLSVIKMFTDFKSLVLICLV